MPRQSRHRSTTDVYHVILRGINRMDIFCDVADRQIFLHYLKSQISENFEVYGLSDDQSHPYDRKKRHTE